MHLARKNERGAVLLTTLLLMTVMAALAVAIMDDIRFSVKRAILVQTSEQMDWFILGAESFAANWLTQNTEGNQIVLNQFILAGAPISLPLDAEQPDGVININIQDGRNCYNVNRLADLKTVKQSRQELTSLLSFMDFDNFEAISISARIQDWVDADIVPLQGGAEDFTYSNKSPPYHAANTMMVDISELRSIEGINEEIYRRLQPFLCARPDKKPNKINVNSLSEMQWPLLATVFGHSDASRKTAQAVIAQRPVAGYESIDAVWALPIVLDLKLKGAGKDMTAIKTDLVNLDIQVNLADQTRRQSVSYVLGTIDGAVLLARRSAF